MSLAGEEEELVSVLWRKEAGTGEPDASMVMFNHVGRPP